MRVHIDDPDLVPALLDFLRARPDTVADRIDDERIEVNLLGSMNAEARERELRLRLEVFEAVTLARGATRILPG